MTHSMEVHGWKATEYTSGQMTLRFNFGKWTWICSSCEDHGGADVPEAAMRSADAHRTKCCARKQPQERRA